MLRASSSLRFNYASAQDDTRPWDCWLLRHGL